VRTPRCNRQGSKILPQKFRVGPHTRARARALTKPTKTRPTRQEMQQAAAGPLEAAAPSSDDALLAWQQREEPPEVYEVPYGSAPLARALRRAHATAPIWAADLPESPLAGNAMAGRKKFLVASYDAFWGHYAQTPPAERFVYEVLENRPSRLYFDLDAAREPNPDLTPERFAELVRTLVGHIRALADELWPTTLSPSQSTWRSTWPGPASPARTSPPAAVIVPAARSRTHWTLRSTRVSSALESSALTRLPRWYRWTGAPAFARSSTPRASWAWRRRTCSTHASSRRNETSVFDILEERKKKDRKKEKKPRRFSVEAQAEGRKKRSDLHFAKVLC
jgi:hypothetical protein